MAQPRKAPPNTSSAKQPQALQLRYLETLTVIAADKNSTIVFPLPLDIVGPLLEAIKRPAG